MRLIDGDVLYERVKELKNKVNHTPGSDTDYAEGCRDTCYDIMDYIKEAPVIPTEKEKRDGILNKPVTYLDLSTRTENLLMRAYIRTGLDRKFVGCKTVGDVAALYNMDNGKTMHSIRGFGGLAFAEVHYKLHDLGLIESEAT